jgi:putative endonuclease
MRWPWTKEPLTRQELGALGERHAARALRAAGLQLLERNFRCRRGELDLIAREGDTLVFIEVRTRTDTNVMTPLESVNERKQARIILLAREYLRTRRMPECRCRYDVVEVTATPWGNVLDIRHLPGAFVEE